MTAKPYQVLALHAIDGQVLLGEFDSKQERDRNFADWHKAWRNGRMDPDVKDICRGDVHGMAPKAEGSDQMYQAFTQGALL